MKVLWTEQAYFDLENIREYIAEDNRSAALSFVKALAATVQKLVDFPYLGRKLPEVDKESIRELLFGEYRIIYRVTSEAVWVLAVIHGRRILNIKILQLSD